QWRSCLKKTRILSVFWKQTQCFSKVSLFHKLKKAHSFTTLTTSHHYANAENLLGVSRRRHVAEANACNHGQCKIERRYGRTVRFCHMALLRRRLKYDMNNETGRATRTKLNRVLGRRVCDKKPENFGSAY
uniref:Uncharacterized protein n=1 Tax=Romanomermis culicivorax TaxID=13658 RepID=A0A915HZT2_ROMCU